LGHPPDLDRGLIRRVQARVEDVRAHDATLGSDADSRLRALVEQAHESGLFNVITSDRRLADDVSLLGAQVIRSAASSTPSMTKVNGTDLP
jgi:hypothetical protein